MTTNLSARRPYSLPFVTRGDPEGEARYSFKVAEWSRYFPQRVLSWLENNTLEVPGQPGLRFLPSALSARFHVPQRRPSLTWLNEVRARLATLMATTQTWNSPALRTTGKIPKPDTDLRITPKP